MCWFPSTNTDIRAPLLFQKLSSPLCNVVVDNRSSRLRPGLQGSRKTRAGNVDIRKLVAANDDMPKQTTKAIQVPDDGGPNFKDQVRFPPPPQVPGTGAIPVDGQTSLSSPEANNITSATNRATIHVEPVNNATIVEGVPVSRRKIGRTACLSGRSDGCCDRGSGNSLWIW